MPNDERASWDNGTPVYDVNGRRVGTLSVGATGDYLVILPDGADAAPLYVPLSAVGRSDATGIYLDLTSTDLADAAWRKPPLP